MIGSYKVKEEVDTGRFIELERGCLYKERKIEYKGEKVRVSF